MVISQLKQLDFELTYQGEVDSFLGTQIISEDSDKMCITQPLLIDAILK